MVSMNSIQIILELYTCLFQQGIKESIGPQDAVDTSSPTQSANVTDGNLYHQHLCYRY